MKRNRTYEPFLEINVQAKKARIEDVKNATYVNIVNYRNYNKNNNNSDIEDITEQNQKRPSQSEPPQIPNIEVQAVEEANTGDNLGTIENTEDNERNQSRSSEKNRSDNTEEEYTAKENIKVVISKKKQSKKLVRSGNASSEEEELCPVQNLEYEEDMVGGKSPGRPLSAEYMYRRGKKSQDSNPPSRTGSADYYNKRDLEDDSVLNIKASEDLSARIRENSVRKSGSEGDVEGSDRESDQLNKKNRRSRRHRRRHSEKNKQLHELKPDEENELVRKKSSDLVLPPIPVYTPSLSDNPRSESSIYRQKMYHPVTLPMLPQLNKDQRKRKKEREDTPPEQVQLEVKGEKLAQLRSVALKTANEMDKLLDLMRIRGSSKQEDIDDVVTCRNMLQFHVNRVPVTFKKVKEKSLRKVKNKAVGEVKDEAVEEIKEKASKQKLPYIQGTPWFHCSTCLEHWNKHQQIVQKCPKLPEPVQGPVITLKFRVAEFVKRFWTSRSTLERQQRKLIMSQEKPKYPENPEGLLSPAKKKLKDKILDTSDPVTQSFFEYERNPLPHSFAKNPYRENKPKRKPSPKRTVWNYPWESYPEGYDWYIPLKWKGSKDVWVFDEQLFRENQASDGDDDDEDDSESDDSLSEEQVEKGGGDVDSLDSFFSDTPEVEDSKARSKPRSATQRSSVGSKDTGEGKRRDSEGERMKSAPAKTKDKSAQKRGNTEFDLILKKAKDTMDHFAQSVPFDYHHHHFGHTDCSCGAASSGSEAALTTVEKAEPETHSHPQLPATERRRHSRFNEWQIIPGIPYSKELKNRHKSKPVSGKELEGFLPVSKSLQTKRTKAKGAAEEGPGQKLSENDTLGTKKLTPRGQGQKPNQDDSLPPLQDKGMMLKSGFRDRKGDRPIDKLRFLDDKDKVDDAGQPKSRRRRGKKSISPALKLLQKYKLRPKDQAPARSCGCKSANGCERCTNRHMKAYEHMMEEMRKRESRMMLPGQTSGGVSPLSDRQQQDNQEMTVEEFELLILGDRETRRHSATIEDILGKEIHDEFMQNIRKVPRKILEEYLNEYVKEDDDVADKKGSYDSLGADSQRSSVSGTDSTQNVQGGGGPDGRGEGGGGVLTQRIKDRLKKEQEEPKPEETDEKKTTAATRRKLKNLALALNQFLGAKTSSPSLPEPPPPKDWGQEKLRLLAEIRDKVEEDERKASLDAQSSAGGSMRSQLPTQLEPSKKSSRKQEQQPDDKVKKNAVKQAQEKKADTKPKGGDGSKLSSRSQTSLASSTDGEARTRKDRGRKADREDEDRVRRSDDPSGRHREQSELEGVEQERRRDSSRKSEDDRRRDSSVSDHLQDSKHSRSKDMEGMVLEGKRIKDAGLVKDDVERKQADDDVSRKEAKGIRDKDHDGSKAKLAKDGDQDRNKTELGKDGDRDRDKAKFGKFGDQDRNKTELDKDGDDTLHKKERRKSEDSDKHKKSEDDIQEWLRGGKVDTKKKRERAQSVAVWKVKSPVKKRLSAVSMEFIDGSSGSQSGSDVTDIGPSVSELDIDKKHTKSRKKIAKKKDGKVVHSTSSEAAKKEVIRPDSPRGTTTPEEPPDVPAPPRTTAGDGGGGTTGGRRLTLPEVIDVLKAAQKKKPAPDAEKLKSMLRDKAVKHYEKNRITLRSQLHSNQKDGNAIQLLGKSLVEEPEPITQKPRDTQDIDDDIQQIAIHRADKTVVKKQPMKAQPKYKIKYVPNFKNTYSPRKKSPVEEPPKELKESRSPTPSDTKPSTDQVKIFDYSSSDGSKSGKSSGIDDDEKKSLKWDKSLDGEGADDGKKSGDDHLIDSHGEEEEEGEQVKEPSEKGGEGSDADDKEDEDSNPFAKPESKRLKKKKEKRRGPRARNSQKNKEIRANREKKEEENAQKAAEREEQEARERKKRELEEEEKRKRKEEEEFNKRLLKEQKERMREWEEEEKARKKREKQEAELKRKEERQRRKQERERLRRELEEQRKREEEERKKQEQEEKAKRDAEGGSTVNMLEMKSRKSMASLKRRKTNSKGSRKSSNVSDDSSKSIKSLSKKKTGLSPKFHAQPTSPKMSSSRARSLWGRPLTLEEAKARLRPPMKTRKDVDQRILIGDRRRVAGRERDDGDEQPAPPPEPEAPESQEEEEEEQDMDQGEEEEDLPQVLPVSSLNLKVSSVTSQLSLPDAVEGTSPHLKWPSYHLIENLFEKENKPKVARHVLLPPLWLISNLWFTRPYTFSCINSAPWYNQHNNELNTKYNQPMKSKQSSPSYTSSQVLLKINQLKKTERKNYSLSPQVIRRKENQLKMKLLLKKNHLKGRRNKQHLEMGQFSDKYLYSMV